MRSRGGETGGLTIMDALEVYEERGYKSQFGAREGGTIKCFTCGEATSADRVEMDSLRRIEGVSDPADEAIVVALHCPACSARGTLTLMYGAAASPEENDALRLLKDAREALRHSVQHGEWRNPGLVGGHPPAGGAGPGSPPSRP